MSFLQTPLFDFLIKQELVSKTSRFDMNFALQYDLSKLFVADLKYRLKIPKKKELRPQRNIMLEVFSQATTGSGKSVFACSIANFGSKINGVHFTAEDNVHFTVADMKEGIKNFHEVGSFHVLDETRRAERSGQGSTQYLSKLSDIGQICRVQGLNFIRILGSMGRMNIANPPHYRFDCLGIDYETEQNKVFLQDNQLRYRGYVIFKKIGDVKFWRDYDKKKIDFVNTTLTSDSVDARGEVFKKMVKVLSEDKRFALCKNKGEREYLLVDLFGIEHSKSVQSLVIGGGLLEAKFKK